MIRRTIGAARDQRRNSMVTSHYCFRSPGRNTNKLLGVQQTYETELEKSSRFPASIKRLAKYLKIISGNETSFLRQQQIANFG